MLDHPHHVRLDSTGSSSSSSGSPVTPDSAYPSFDLYPFPLAYGDMHTDPQQSNYFLQSPQQSQQAVAMMEPRNTVSMQHYSPNCSQIPKLRVACSTGVSGRRSMWSYCEQCGAIQMVDAD
ncbi:hypothetical protein JAAARDRAFT_35364 [Jaapia argillacea MUCL 33604]|uniref:Uncharacterized protein n=1 Tax=Jaapia argillacea MUCL 33604 TaxID=933084 RepID=A0A067PS80_9AGAM|nr:hypothetical protein JAAARDRAFT_35364 [Jaapia argillacea MUCL 33604]